MADEQRVIGVSIQAQVDQTSFNQAKAQINNIGAGTAAGATGSGGKHAYSGEIDPLQYAVSQANLLAKNTGVTFADAAKKLEGFASAGGYTADQIIAANDATQKLDQSTKQLDQTTQTATKSLRGIGFEQRIIGRNISQVGMVMAGIGAAGILAYTKAADTYVKKFGAVEEVSRAWLATTQQIDESTTRLGRVAAQALTPWHDQLAAIENKMADIAEANPALASGLLGAFKVAGALGGTLTAVGTGFKLVADAKLLSTAVGQITAEAANTAALNANTAAQLGKAATGAAGAEVVAAGSAGASLLATGVIPAAIAATIAMLGYNAVAGKTEYGKNLTPGLGGAVTGAENTVAMYWTMNAALLGKFADVLGITTNAANDWGKAVSKATGLTPTTAVGAKSTYSAAEIDAYIAMRKEEAAAEQQYNDQRTQIAQEAGTERAAIEASSEAERTQIVADAAKKQAQETQDFHTQIARENEDLQRTQAKELADFNAAQADAAQKNAQQRADILANLKDQLAQIDQSYKDQLRQMARGHSDTLNDLIAKRDALGIVQENRRYAAERQDAKTAHDEQRKQAIQQARQQLADNARQFQEEQKQRAQDFQEKQAQEKADLDYRQQQEEADFNTRMEREKADMADRLKLLDQQKKDELKKLDDAERQKLNDLAKQYQAEKTQRLQAANDQFASLMGLQKQYDKDSIAEATAYFDQMKKLWPAATDTSGVAGSGGHAAGGYAYWPGEKQEEFVLSNPTTRAAERMAGGRLSQSTLLSMMAGAGGGQTINVNISLPAGVLNSQIKSIVKMSKEETLNEFAKILDTIQ